MASLVRNAGACENSQLSGCVRGRRRPTGYLSPAEVTLIKYVQILRDKAQKSDMK
jgi:hypothetical protein